VRESGAIDMLVSTLCDPCPDVHQRALHIISNLSSDAFDPESSLTKQIFTQSGGVGMLVPLLEGEDPATAMYAAAATQNLALDEGFSVALAAGGAIESLQKLIASDVPEVARFAAGALKNVLQRESNSQSPDPATSLMASRR